MDPLETRSMPDGLWQRVPEWIKSTDIALQQRMEWGPGPWRDRLIWLTADPQGIALSLGALAVAIAATWIFRRRRLSGRELARDFAKLAGRALLAVPFVALSDLASSRVKLLIGRLKPHVNFYNPAVVPALSLPSNHAFNSAFALALLWFSLPRESRRAWGFAFVIAAIVLACVGVSRVWFGQHYPLDVLAGWILGGTLGRAAALVYGWASFRTPRK